MPPDRSAVPQKYVTSNYPTEAENAPAGIARYRGPPAGQAAPSPLWEPSGILRIPLPRTVNLNEKEKAPPNESQRPQGADRGAEATV